MTNYVVVRREGRVVPCSDAGRVLANFFAAHASISEGGHEQTASIAALRFSV